MKLTETNVAKLKPAGKRVQHFDNSVRSFGVRVDPSGRKSFLWYQKVCKKVRFRALGEFPFVSVKDARTRATALAGKAAAWKRDGYPDPDPFEKGKPIEPPPVPTFKALVEAYIRDQVRPNANHPERAEYEVNWKVKRHFSDWLDCPVDSITVQHVLAVKNECGERRHLANRAVEFVRTLFSWSAKSKNGKINFWPVDNPAKSIELHDEEPRERFLQPDELVRFNEALEKEPCADLKDFLILAINSGARKGDLFGMRWADIHWERETWRVPFPKNATSYDVALLPSALAVLERRRGEAELERQRREAPETAVYVFPSWGSTGHLTDLKKPWLAFKKRAQIPDIRMHDIRRSVGSYLAMSNVSLQQIGAALGHKSLASTAIYAKLHSQAVRDSREKGMATMATMMKIAKRRAKKLAAPKVSNRKQLAAVNRG